MKKNFSVNIGGRVFNIDEDAYERFNNYLSRLKAYFATEQGCDEILADIESRIAELLEQKRPSASGIITLDLINEVIAGMGEPDQFANQETADIPPSQGTRVSGKLFRDPDNRLIGGVAAGIAAYFKIDPTWIRILFAISTFTYAIGVIVYIILWLILPEARTTSERLEMQRRMINIDTLREEINSAGTGLRKTGNSLLHSIGSILRFFTEIITHVFRLLLQVIRLAGGATLILLVLTMFVGLSLAYLIREPFHTGMYHLDNISLGQVFAWIMPGPSVLWLAYLASILVVIGIAGLFIYLGLRMLFKWPPMRWQIMGVFGVLILAGLITGGGAVYQYSRSTNETATKSQLQVFPYQQKLIRLELTPDNPDLFWKPLEGGDPAVRSKMALGDIQFSIRPAKDSLFITQIRQAASFQESIASDYLENLEYEFTLKDTLLSLNPYFSFPKADGMHHQSMEMIIGIPVNTLVRLNEDINWRCNHRDFLYRNDEGGDYIMTGSGLKPVEKEMEKQ